MMAQVDGKKIWLNLHHLYYFYIIVKEGSLTKASDILLVGPPTLSSQIKQLEGTLGYDLFTRKSKKFDLTQEGKKVFGYAEKIFRLGQELVETVIAPGKDSPKRNLRMGLPDSIPKELIVTTLKKVLSQPDATVSFKEGRSEELLKDLRVGEIDVMFLNSPPPPGEQKDFFYKKIASSPLVIAGNQNFSQYKKGFPQSLKDLSFMLPMPNGGARIAADSFFSQEKITVNRIGETKDESMLKMFAVEGLSLIVTPLASIKDLLDSKELVEIGRLNEEESVYLIANNSWNNSKNAKYISGLLEL